VIIVSVEIDSEGYARGFEVGRRSYRELQHPPMSYSLAKWLLSSCPEDAHRLTLRSERVERESTDAMDDGNVLDALLTATEPYDPARLEYLEMTAPTKKATDPVSYGDWNGLRIIQAESLQTAAAKLAASSARAEGLVPVLFNKLTREVHKAQDLLIRMELAGFDRSKYLYQVSLYWTEDARNGMRVQCRGRLDFLSHDWTSIVDLKRVEDLAQLSLERSVDRYKWAMQAAAYSRAVYMLQGCQWVPTWKWLFARTSPVVACTLRPADAALLQAGEAAWNRAVNDWAEGLATGMWRGHESDHTPLNPTSWALDQMEVDLV
jgi:hypothetical protein